MKKQLLQALILLVPAFILVVTIPMMAFNKAKELGYTNGYSTFSTSGTITPLVFFVAMGIGFYLLFKLAKFTNRFIQA